jgi:hypothetical protein
MTVGLRQRQSQADQITTLDFGGFVVLRNSNRVLDSLLLLLVAGLTLATAYIHFWVGGVMLILNAMGYVTLLGGVLLTAVAFRRGLPLVLAALAGYAGVTIVGWLVIGPYFDVAYLAKAIEVGLISAISIHLLRHRVESREAVLWAVGLAGTILRRTVRRAPVAPAAAGDE